jgi:hypothetical protein
LFILTLFSLLLSAIPELDPEEDLDDPEEDLDEVGFEDVGTNTILVQMYLSMFTKMVLPWDMLVVGVASIAALLKQGDELFFGRKAKMDERAELV